VGPVGSNPAYSPEVPNNNWFAMMFSGGIPSSNATGWKQGKHLSDDFEPINDNPLYICEQHLSYCIY